MSVSPVVSCANCGHRFVGRWCPKCGQEVVDLRRSFSQIVVEFLGDFLAFDARIRRTAIPLFAKPGFLTRQYVTGHRAPYVPPLRLYVFAGFAFFAVFALTGGGPIRIVAEEQSSEGIVRFDFDSGDEIPAVEGDGERHWFWGRLEQAAREPGRFQDAFVQSLGYAHFLIVPLFALLLKLLWRRRYYAEHLVFSAHLHAFELLTGAAIIAVYALAGNPAPESTAANATVDIWSLVVGLYLFVALRRVYEGRRWKLAMKFGALALAYLLVIAFVMGMVAFLSVFFL